MRFVKVKDPYTSFPPHWAIHVQSQDELREWYEHQTHVSEGVRDAWTSVSQGRHASTEVGGFIEMRKGLGFPVPGALEMAQLMTDAIYQPKADTLKERGSILIYVNGSFNFPTEGYEFLETVERDPMDWPEIDGNVRYIKWPGGNHWYAKVGPHDVIVNGEQKWNTKREAKEAASTFLASH